MDRFPNEIRAEIYQWDATFLCILRERVLAEMTGAWMWDVADMLDRHFTIRNYMEDWAVPPPCVLNGQLYIRGFPLVESARSS